ncbi:MAG: T9SS type A sorting domain-containing protein [Sphingobacteriales bacterium]|nr:MAG: T9SS type A sorting domain-containing protein [Sphingobacteriales bacterium]
MFRKPTRAIGLAVLLLSLSAPTVSNGQCIPPSVTSQPAYTTVCNGGTTTLTVAGAGTDISFQWEVNTGSGYAAITNNTTYSGATTNALSIAGAASSMGTYQYRCVISGACTPNATSDAAGFTIHNTPSISTQPQAATICAGNNAGFSVVATGTDVTYKWQVNTGSGFADVANGGVYSGATTSDLAITGATVSMNSNQYRCLVTNACTTLTSDAVSFTVNAPAAVTTSPASALACGGGNKTFTVAATGLGLTYQWQMDDGSGFGNISDGGAYSGTGTANLDITGAVLAMNGQKFRCVVTGTCNPSAVSGEATLSVYDAPVITAQPSASVLCEGLNTSFTTAATGTPLNYQWEVDNGSGFTNVNNAGVYSGANTATLSITGAATNLSGLSFRCVVGNTCATQTGNAVALTVNALPVITAQPASAVICAGSNAVFSVANSGSTMNYMWQENSGSGFANITNGGIYSGATTGTLTLNAPAAALSGRQYRCILDNGNCTLTSGNATLTINVLPAITTQPVSAIICEGANASFTTAATGTGVTYQWQENTGSGFANITNGGIYGGATTATLAITAAGLSTSGYQYRCVVTGTCSPEATTADVTLTVNEKPSILVQPINMTVCTGTNALFTVATSGTGLTYQWQVDNGTGFLNINNGSLYSGANAKTLILTAPTAQETGYKYRVAVSGTCAPAVTSANGVLTVNDVKIINESGNNTACEDKSAMFSATAKGTVVTYQWQVNDGLGYANVANNATYSGAQTSALSILSADVAMTGLTYRCIVNGVCTHDTTADMKLTVNQKPQITQHPVSVTVKENKDVSFKIGALGYDFYYYWQASTDDGKTFVNIQDNGTYSGSRTNEMTVKSVAVTQDGYSFRCIVKEKGACNFAADSSSWAYLDVQSSLSVNDQVSNAQINVYPNPVSGSTLNISLPVAANVEVRILNAMGQTVSKQMTDAIKGQDTKIDVANIPAGVYMLYVVDTDKQIGQPVRFVKQ